VFEEGDVVSVELASGERRCGRVREVGGRELNGKFWYTVELEGGTRCWASEDDLQFYRPCGASRNAQ
jgi:hypothetical protein